MLTEEGIEPRTKGQPRLGKGPRHTKGQPHLVEQGHRHAKGKQAPPHLQVLVCVSPVALDIEDEDEEYDAQVKQAQANSYQTKEEEDATRRQKEVHEAMQKLLGPKQDETNPVIRLIVNLLRKPIFKLSEYTRAEYFDFLSHVMDTYPDLVKGVKNIVITRNCDETYEENIFQFESVIGELIALSSLESLTLNQFKAQEIIRILATLSSQTKLRYLNLCNNSLYEGDLSFVVRSLPPSKQPLVLELGGNYLSDQAYIKLMVSMHPNVEVRVGQQIEEPTKARQSRRDS